MLNNLEQNAKYLSCVFFCILFILSADAPVIFAKDAYVYGMDQAGRGEDFTEFQRINIHTEAVEILNAEIPIVYPSSVKLSAIDTRRGHYCYIFGGEFVVLDLESGERLSSHSTKDLRPIAFEYDRAMDSYYVFHGQAGFHLARIDPETFENVDIISLGELAAPGSRYTTYVDGYRGRLGYMSQYHRTFYTFDLSTGELINEVENELALETIGYNHADGLYYGVTDRNTTQLAFVVIDPLNGDILTRNLYSEFGIDELNFSQFHRPAVDYSAGEASVVYLTSRGLFKWQPESSTAKKLDRATFFTAARLYNAGFKRNHLTGFVYADPANDCVRDAGDDPLVGMALDFSPGDYRFFSGSDGRFRAFLPAGTYTLDLQAEWPWSIDCTSLPRQLVVDAMASEPVEFDVAAYPEVRLEHLELSIVSSRLIAGRTVQFDIRAVNRGTIAFNGALRFTHDPILEQFESRPMADRTAANVAEWDIEDLPIGDIRHFVVTMSVPARQDLHGELLCARVELVEKREDLLASDQFDEICSRVLVSYDPNDISVAPVGFGERGKIASEDSTLAYTIRFQNIGDAPAFDVVILDTLDDDLDINTLHFGAATHEYTVGLLDGKVLEFRFEGIELPGKSEDEPGSHGALKYKIDLKKGLPENTEIHNRAAIYFDFNEPIITNTVVNTVANAVTNVEGIADHDELELRSLANGLFVLHGFTSLNGRLSVYSVLGRKVFEREVQNAPQATIDLGSLPGGQYLIRYGNSTTSFVRTVNVAR